MRLIIFDVDGTLVDSQHDIVEAQAQAFAAHGLPAPDRATALSVVGLSLREAFLTLAGPEAPVDDLAEAYKAAWRELHLRQGFRQNLYPGAADLIAEFAVRSDVVLGIATGKSRAGVARLVAAQGWQDAFVTIQTADEHPSKPHPAMLRAALVETGVAADSAMMVGDTTFDMEMAAAAGVASVGVAWGYHPPSALLESGALEIVGDFQSLRQVLATQSLSCS